MVDLIPGRFQAGPFRRQPAGGGDPQRALDTGSGDIASYAIAPDGILTLLSNTPVSSTPGITGRSCSLPIGSAIHSTGGVPEDPLAAAVQGLGLFVQLPDTSLGLEQRLATASATNAPIAAANSRRLSSQA